jgi:S-disulfanyl-L-cysteine oxidoreductase SoxD
MANVGVHKMKVAIGILTLIGSWFLAGCDGDPNQTKLQFMPDMADGPTVKAQESYLEPPAHSVAVDAILYPAAVEKAETEMVNPLPNTDENLEHGKKLFNTFCAVCHGEDGKGGGTLGEAYPVARPDITRAEMAQRKDGFFFTKISAGGPIMPAYGHAISPQERWLITQYLRKLQEVK